ncbi:hypothetical protein ACPTHL_18260 [Pseudomonas aeruginosa]|uniref:hypothetical protein n=1 Tax=Pseudomonas aeruginosa TaxID=287 RepID=UPI0018C67D1C|nr:hypothetical protein [Pseudomonas aeruginosa]
MDANYFLTSRLDMIAQFYKVAAAPFFLIKKQIEDGEAPYEPPYSEDGEPPFLLEWTRAEDSLKLLGGVCVSLVAGSLQLYLDTIVERYGNLKEFKEVKGAGWLKKHQNYFKMHGYDFQSSGADLALLSEVILARNAVIHHDQITSDVASYSDDDLKKIPSPFFVSEREQELLSNLKADTSPWLYPPTIHVDENKLLKAIAEAKKLAASVDPYQVQLQ